MERGWVAGCVALALVTVACDGPPGTLSAPAGAQPAPPGAQPAPPDAQPAPPDLLPAPPDAQPACSLKDVQTIPMPGSIEAGAYTLVSDVDGYVLVWGNANELADPDAAGVFAMRAGGKVKHLVPKVDAAFHVAAVPTPSGFLICYDGGAEPNNQGPDPGCLMVDADLNVTQAPAPSPFGTVERFATDGSSISALASMVDSAGLPGPLMLTPVDAATGGAAGKPAPLPCKAAGSHLAITPAAIACLVPSDPGCGGQFYTGGACTYGLELYARDGTPIASHRAIAPFGGWGDLIDVQLAARNDGYLVAWPDKAGVHLVHVGPDGAVAAPHVISNAGLGTLAVVPSGYIDLTTATYPDVPGAYQLPQIAPLTPDGSVAHAPVWLATPPQPFRLHYASEVSVATRDGGFGVAWRSQNGLVGNDERAALQLRQVGCDVGALPAVKAPANACPSDPPLSLSPGTCPPPPPAPGDCAKSGGAGCFVLPSAALAVAGGAPDLSCIGSGPIQLFVHPVTVSGTIRDVGGAAVPGATLEEFSDGDFTAPTVATTADASGAYSITLPPDTSEYPLWRTRGDGLLDAIQWRGARIDPSQTSVGGIDQLAFRRTTADSWAATAGTTFADCDTLFVLRVVDCQERPIAHAVVTLTAGNGNDACPTFIPGTRVVYLGSDGAPVSRSALTETGAAGKAAIFGAPRTYFNVQVYGYLSDADRAAGKLTLLSYIGLRGRGNTVQESELFPRIPPYQ